MTIFFSLCWIFPTGCLLSFEWKVEHLPPTYNGLRLLGRLVFKYMPHPLRTVKCAIGSRTASTDSRSTAANIGYNLRVLCFVNCCNLSTTAVQSCTIAFQSRLLICTAVVDNELAMQLSNHDWYHATSIAIVKSLSGTAVFYPWQPVSSAHLETVDRL
jgi:hypothetical protein